MDPFRPIPGSGTHVGSGSPPVHRSIAPSPGITAATANSNQTPFHVNPGDVPNFRVASSYGNAPPANMTGNPPLHSASPLHSYPRPHSDFQGAYIRSNNDSPAYQSAAATDGYPTQYPNYQSVNTATSYEPASHRRMSSVASDHGTHGQSESLATDSNDPFAGIYTRINNLDRKLEKRSSKSQKVYEELQAEHNKLKTSSERDINSLKDKSSHLEELYETHNGRLREYDENINKLDGSITRWLGDRDKKIGNVSSGLATCINNVSSLANRMISLEEGRKTIMSRDEINALIGTRISAVEERVSASSQVLQTGIEGQLLKLQQGSNSIVEDVSKLETLMSNEFVTIKEDLDKKLGSVSKQVTAMWNKLDAKTAELTLQSGRMTELEKQVSENAAQNEGLVNKTTKMQTQFVATTKNLDLLTEHVMKLRTEGLPAHTGPLTSRMAKLESVIERQEKRLEEMTIQLAETTSKTQESNEHVIRETVEVLSQRIQELEKLNRNEQVDDLIKNDQYREKRLQNLETKTDVVSQLSSAIEHGKALESLRSRVETMERNTQNSTAHDRFVAVDDKIGRFDERLTNIMTSIHNDKRLEQLRDDRVRLEERVCKLQDNDKEHSDEIKRLNDGLEHIETLEALVMKTQEKVARTEQKSDDADQTIVKDFKEFNQEVNDRTEHFNETIAKLQADIEDLKLQLQEQQQQRPQPSHLSLVDSIARIRRCLEESEPSAEVGLEMGRLFEVFSKTTSSVRQSSALSSGTTTEQAALGGKSRAHEVSPTTAVQPQTPSSSILTSTVQEPEQDRRRVGEMRLQSPLVIEVLGELRNEPAVAGYLRFAPPQTRAKLEEVKEILVEHVDARTDKTLFWAKWDEKRLRKTEKLNRNASAFSIRDQIGEIIASQDEGGGRDRGEIGSEGGEHQRDVDQEDEVETPRRSVRDNRGKRTFEGVVSWSKWREENKARKKARLS